MSKIKALLTIIFCSLPNFALGQVSPETAIFSSTVSRTEDGILVVNDGIQAGGNLFHGFQSFSTRPGEVVFFQTSSDISSIFASVLAPTGANINGEIRTSGNADFFLLSPGGIIFGPGSKFNVGGSFIASTASTLSFSDEKSFSIYSDVPNSLSSAVLTSLSDFTDGSAITVNGSGQELKLFDNGLRVAARRGEPLASSDLRLEQAQTFALLSEIIKVSEGVVTVPGGHIELIATSEEVKLFKSTNLDENLVELKPKWFSSFSESDLTGKIELVGSSLIDVSDFSAGSITLAGKDIEILDRSKLVAQSQRGLANGDIKVITSDKLKLAVASARPVSIEVFNTPLILSESLSSGRAGNIHIAATDAVLLDGAAIVSSALSTGESGNILIDVNNSIKVSGGLNPLSPSIVTNQTFADSDSGSISIRTKILDVLDGGRITSTSFGSGNAGLVGIYASEKIDVIGTVPNFPVFQSGLSSDAFRDGNSGKLKINTGRLRLIDGGDAVASTFASGDAGDVEIQASVSIEISGFKAVSIPEFPKQNVSSISSSARIQPQPFIRDFGLPPMPSGGSGNVTINSPELIVSNSAEIAVANDGLQDAGALSISADKIILKDGGQITGSTANGTGGDIYINSLALGLTGNSSITTNAGNQGDGGNITINSDFIAAPLFQDNDISANADKGNGGNVAINTLGLLGLAAAEEDSPTRNDITATSETGLSGTVAIQNFDIDSLPAPRRSPHPPHPQQPPCPKLPRRHPSSR